MKQKPEHWQQHTPRIGPDGEDQNTVLDCDGCGWESTEREYGALGFATHMQEVGAPDYMIGYFKFWAEIVEVPTGELDRDAVARELADYEVIMEGASAVYSELAGLSKPNTAPQYVIQGAEEKYREHYAYSLGERALDLEQHEKPELAQELWNIAEEWHPGTREQVYRDEAFREEIFRDELAKKFAPRG